MIPLKITALMDDLASEHHGLRAEHGLSLWVERDGMCLLFDFGSSDAVLHNAHLLGIELSGAQAAVCSHAHYDHCGGFLPLAQLGLLSRLVTGAHFFERKYAFDGMKHTFLGANFGPESLSSAGIVHDVCKDLLELAPGCWAVGRFVRDCPGEQVPERFVKETAAGMQPDAFDDEICLALDSPQGLVVVCGCAHPGILNMLHTVSTRLKRPVFAVLGGTHLVEADRTRIAFTIDEMKRMGLHLLAFSHCSGELAQQMLRDDPDVHSCHLGAGESILL